MSVNASLQYTNYCASTEQYHYVLCMQSMPSIEEATELSSSELDGGYKEDETRCASSSLLGEQEVSISALLAVICHKVIKMKDENSLPSGVLSQEEHTEVFPFESSNWAFKEIQLLHTING